VGKNYDLKSSDLLGLSAFQFIHQDDTARTLEWFSDCLKQHFFRSLHENRQVKLSTGAVFLMLWSARLRYCDKGQIKKIDFIGLNITSTQKQRKE
jgi:hypothetical protein